MLSKRPELIEVAKKHFETTAIKLFIRLVLLIGMYQSCFLVLEPEMHDLESLEIIYIVIRMGWHFGGTAWLIIIGIYYIEYRKLKERFQTLSEFVPVEVILKEESLMKEYLGLKDLVNVSIKDGEKVSPYFAISMIELEKGNHKGYLIRGQAEQYFIPENLLDFKKPTLAKVPAA